MREDPNSRHAALSEGPAAAKPLSEAPSTEEAPAPAGAADAPAKSPSTNELATTPQDSGESAGASASTAKPAAAPAPVQPTLATELSAPPVGDLTLDFKAPSWARVEDSTGKLLLSGVIPSGAHQVLGGKAPYSVFLGNAPGVSVQYQGHPFNVSSFVKSNDTARFSVPGAGG
jgi:cytoskeleton protein RodZ